jgi:hypothetical protein
MANMDISQRQQYERADLGDSKSTRLLTARSPKWLIVYTLLCLPLLGVLIWTLVAGFQGWPHAVVIGAIVMTTVGLMIAVSPTRRA